VPCGAWFSEAGRNEYYLCDTRLLSVFPHDIKPAPRSYAEAFLNVCDYVEHQAGGHFAAWEQPQTYADDVRRAVKLGR
jgi:hypothetical protein